MSLEITQFYSFVTAEPGLFQSTDDGKSEKGC